MYLQQYYPWDIIMTAPALYFEVYPTEVLNIWYYGCATEQYIVSPPKTAVGVQNTTQNNQMVRYTTASSRKE